MGRKKRLFSQSRGAPGAIAVASIIILSIACGAQETVEPMLMPTSATLQPINSTPLSIAPINSTATPGLKPTPTNTPEGRWTPMPTWTPATSDTPPLRHPDLDGIVVRSVCLVTDVSFTNPQYDDRPSEITERILGGLGIEIMSGGQECDAALTIGLIGNSRSEIYATVGTCFNGNSVSGHVYLEIEGNTPVTIPVAFTTAPPSSISSANCTESRSSVSYNLNCSKAVISGLVDLWGAPVLGQIMPYTYSVRMALERMYSMGADPGEAVPDLIRLLLDEDPFVSCNAAGTLGMMDPPPLEAVPWLIQALAELGTPDEWQFLGTGACHFNALKTMTGQEFNQIDLWQQWWDEQQQ